ncbi:hypothetical protein PPS11_00625 [Pseudomonas putida S11]|nr:hypothetical protein PPS11_00625 [Pseudomonas putida S11]
MERILENAMYASRWLLAPIYFGLSLGLLALALKFFQERGPRPAQRLRPQRSRPDPGDPVADRHVAGGRPAGDGDDLRLRELRLATGHRREQGKAQLAGQDGLFVAEDEGCRIDCGHFVHPPAAGVHGRTEHLHRLPDVVRDHPHDLRGLGILHGLSGQADQALNLSGLFAIPVGSGQAREEAGTVQLTSGVNHALCIRPFCTKNRALMRGSHREVLS